MRLALRSLLAMFLVAVSAAATASFHLWQSVEVYSNADGSVQFLELTETSGGFGGQQFLTGHGITSSDGVTTNSYTFTTNLPGNSANKKFLIGTTGFAALGIVTPDYVVPNGFFFRAGGTINFAGGFDVWIHGAMPSGTLSLNRDGSTATATPTNFAGATGSLPEPPQVIAIAPSPVAFAPNSINTTSFPNVVTITNNHSSAVTISAVTVSGDFTVMPQCTTLGAGASCQAGMYFTPTAAGARNGTLTVTSDAPGSPHTAPVTGTGELSLVTHYYRAILGRAPDAPGKAFWEAEATRMSGLGANVNETWFAMAQQFFFSAEYLAFNRTDSQFVEDLYLTFFNRPADAPGLAFWTDQVTQGMPREVVLAAFMFSTEFATFTQAIFGNTAARAEVDVVVDFYRGLLARLPDDGGFGFWVQQFRTAQCAGAGAAGAVYTQVESISSSFATGGEYLGRNRTNAQYVGDLYNSFLRRGGDLGGVSFWINQLDTAAMTREFVRQQFIASGEFTGRVNAVIAQGCLP